MANTVSWILQLHDKASAVMGKAGTVADAFTGKVKGIQAALVKTQSIAGQQSKLDHLFEMRNAATTVTDIAKINRQIGIYEQNINRLENLGKGANPFTNLKNSVMDAVPALGLIANPIVAGTAAIAGATKTSLDFEQGMAKVNGTLGLSKTELGQLKTNLIAAGKGTGADFASMPDGLNRIVSAGYDAKRGLEIMKPATIAAAAGFVSVAEAADAGASIFASYPTMDATRGFDIMFAAVNKGKVEFRDLATEMPQIIPTAKAVGYTLEQSASAFSYLTAKGVKANEATTQLNGVFRAFQNTDFVDKMKAAGIQIFDANGKINDLTKIALGLNRVTGQMTDKQRGSFYNAMKIDAEAAKSLQIMSQDVTTFGDITKTVTSA